MYVLIYIPKLTMQSETVHCKPKTVVGLKNDNTSWKLFGRVKITFVRPKLALMSFAVLHSSTD